MARKPHDIDAELQAVIDRARQEKSEPPESDGARDSKVQVHVYGAPRSKAPPLPPQKESAARAILNNDWVKLIAAFVLGGAGSEAHSVVRGDEATPEADERIVKIERAQVAMRKEIRALDTEGTATRQDLYALGRFSFHVMKQQGVRVYLKEGVEAPAVVEFGPPPLKAKLPPAVQPNESFPLPKRP